MSYKATIGIECHVQLKTATKLFAAVGNDARTAAPNTLISPICLGMPGALPVLNKAAVELAAKAAFALNTRPQKFSKFDRKHYFYPDLPLGYQITQFEEPIILGGHVDIEVAGEKKRINITRAHLEADAGKSTHPEGADHSLVDLNRAGTPLLEIVSEPDMHSSAEAAAFAHELYLLMSYYDVSDADLYHGNMRFDVNVSVSKNDELGTRTETKNLNSFRSVAGAVDYEIKRQTELLESGGTVVQETRGWDDNKLATFSQRTKEDAHDYRYFPDPDLPPVVLDDKFIARIEGEINEGPSQLRDKFSTLGVSKEVVNDLVNIPSTARILSSLLNRADADIVKRVAFWLLEAQEEFMQMNEAAQQEFVNDTEKSKPEVTEEMFLELSKMTAEGTLSSTSAKDVLRDMFKTGKHPLEIAEAKNVIQESDESALIMIVEQVLSENPKAAEDIKNGELKAIGFLVGQVMKASKGKANPSVVTDLIKKQLGV